MRDPHDLETLLEWAGEPLPALAWCEHCRRMVETQDGSILHHAVDPKNLWAGGKCLGSGAKYQQVTMI